MVEDLFIEIVVDCLKLMQEQPFKCKSNPKQIRII